MTFGEAIERVQLYADLGHLLFNGLQHRATECRYSRRLPTTVRSNNSHGSKSAIQFLKAATYSRRLPTDDRQLLGSAKWYEYEIEKLLDDW